MFDLPTLSSWDGLHPSVSHFPIVLLVLVPLCLVAALAWKKHRPTLIAVTLGLALIGTVTAYVSAATGDAARDVAKEAGPQTPEVKQAVQTHEDLASIVRAGSTVATALLAALMFGPGLLKKKLSDGQLVAGLVGVLVVSLVVGLVLLNTAHTGGLLVHKLGMHAHVR